MRVNHNRRGFLKTCAGLGAGLTASWAGFHTLAAAERKKVRIVDIKTMVVQGPRTYTYVKVLTDAGVYGLGEAYGSPGVGVPESIAALKEYFVGKDPLSIEALLAGLGNRFDGSAHMLLRGISGIEMALWDLAGKILDVPTTVLLGGPFRTKMRMYTGQGPRNMLDKASCRDWIAEVKASKAGWTAFKLGPPGGFGGGEGERPARPRQSEAPQEPPNGFNRPAQTNRVYSRKQLMDIQQGFENVREAIGWERDVMFHGQWNYDLLAAIQLSQALEPVKPLWIEDPMPPDFSNAWVHLTQVSKVPILTGENLGRRQDWVPFFEQKGIHIAQLDVRNTGGLLESKKIADLADVHLIPMCAHDTASIVCNYGVLHWACAVRDFIAAETRIGNGDWMDDIILHDAPVIKDGYMTLPEKPGLGIELNPDVVKAHLVPGQTWWG
jgi:L-alanine-DL-glutamate epimerase-like enolase superfamily enzyme